MTESSVRIKLGLELDKRDFKNQVEELQSELAQYRLKIGVQPEFSEEQQDGGTPSSSQPKIATFESGQDETSQIDFTSITDTVGNILTVTNSLFESSTAFFQEAIATNKEILDVLKKIEDCSCDDKKKPVDKPTESSQVTDYSTVIDAIDQATTTLNGTLQQIQSAIVDLNLTPSTEKETDVKESKLSTNNEKADSNEKSNPNKNIASGFIDQVKSLIGEIKDLIPDIIKTSLGNLTEIAIDLLKNSSGVLTSNITDIVSQTLSDLKDFIQDSLKDFINNVTPTSDTKQNKKERSNDNSAQDSISSSTSTIIGIIDNFRESIINSLNSIVEDLLPELISSNKFDLIKSLIIGAVENLGADLTQQFSSGSANALKGLITGQTFQSENPGAAISENFLKGFESADPTMNSRLLSSVEDMRKTSAVGALSAEESKLLGQSHASQIVPSEVIDAEIIDFSELTSGQTINEAQLEAVIAVLTSMYNYITKLKLEGVVPALLASASNSLQINPEQPLSANPPTDQSNPLEIGSIDIDLSDLETPLSDSIDILRDILLSSEDLETLSREAVIKERVGLDKLTGNSALDNASKPKNTKDPQSIFNKIPRILQGLNNAAVSGGKALGIDPATILGVSTSISSFITAVTSVTDLLRQNNPELVGALEKLANALVNDGTTVFKTGYEKLNNVFETATNLDIKNQIESRLDTALAKVNIGKINLGSVYGELKKQILTFGEKSQAIGSKVKSAAQSTVGLTKGIIIANLPSNVENTLSSLDAKLGELIGKIGALVGALGKAINNSETAEALTKVIQEIKNVIPAQEQQKTSNPPTGDPLESNSSTPTPSGDPPDPNNSNPDIAYRASVEPTTGQQDKSLQDLANTLIDLSNFIKSVLPKLIVGLLVVKLGAAILNRGVGAVTGNTAKLPANDIQGILNKILIGAVATGLSQVVVPKIAEFFKPETASASNRTLDILPKFLKDILSTPAAQKIAEIKGGPPAGGDVQYRAEKSGETGSTKEALVLIAKAVGTAVLSNVTKSSVESSADSSKGFKGLAEAPKNLFQGIFDGLAFVPKAIAGLKDSFQAIPGVKPVKKALIKSTVQSEINTRGDKEQRKVAKFTSDALLPPDEVEGVFKKLQKTLLDKGLLTLIKNPKLMKLPGVGAGIKALAGSRVSDTIDSAGESLKSRVVPRISNAILPEEQAQGKGGKAAKFLIDKSLEGLFNSLFNLFGDPAKEISKSAIGSGTDFLTGKTRPDVLGNGIDLILNNLPTTLVGLLVAQLLAKVVPAIAKILQNRSEAISEKELNKSFEILAQAIFKSAGLNFNPEELAKILPNVKADSGNLLEGGSSYSSGNNQITLAQDTASKLTSGDINTEVITVVAHELRHAMQQAFGNTKIKTSADLPKELEEKNIKVTESQSTTPYTLGDLVDTSSIEAVLEQVKASIEATTKNNPNVDQKLIENLETDAEVFAQNIALELAKTASETSGLSEIIKNIKEGLSNLKESVLGNDLDKPPQPDKVTGESQGDPTNDLEKEPQEDTKASPLNNLIESAKNAFSENAEKFGVITENIDGFIDKITTSLKIDESTLGNVQSSVVNLVGQIQSALEIKQAQLEGIQLSAANMVLNVQKAFDLGAIALNEVGGVATSFVDNFRDQLLTAFNAAGNAFGNINTLTESFVSNLAQALNSLQQAITNTVTGAESSEPSETQGSFNILGVIQSSLMGIGEKLTSVVAPVNSLIETAKTTFVESSGLFSSVPTAINGFIESVQQSFISMGGGFDKLKTSATGIVGAVQSGLGASVDSVVKQASLAFAVIGNKISTALIVEDSQLAGISTGLSTFVDTVLNALTLDLSALGDIKVSITNLFTEISQSLTFDEGLFTPVKTYVDGLIQTVFITFTTAGEILSGVEAPVTSFVAALSDVFTMLQQLVINTANRISEITVNPSEDSEENNQSPKQAVANVLATIQNSFNAAGDRLTEIATPVNNFVQSAQAVFIDSLPKFANISDSVNQFITVAQTSFAAAQDNLGQIANLTTGLITGVGESVNNLVVQVQGLFTKSSESLLNINEAIVAFIENIQLALSSDNGQLESINTALLAFTANILSVLTLDSSVLENVKASTTNLFTQIGQALTFDESLFTPVKTYVDGLLETIFTAFTLAGEALGGVEAPVTSFVNVLAERFTKLIDVVINVVDNLTQKLEELANVSIEPSSPDSSTTPPSDTPLDTSTKPPGETLDPSSSIIPVSPDLPPDKSGGAADLATTEKTQKAKPTGKIDTVKSSIDSTLTTINNINKNVDGVFKYILDKLNLSKTAFDNVGIAIASASVGIGAIGQGLHVFTGIASSLGLELSGGGAAAGLTTLKTSIQAASVSIGALIISVQGIKKVIDGTVEGINFLGKRAIKDLDEIQKAIQIAKQVVDKVNKTTNAIIQSPAGQATIKGAQFVGETVSKGAHVVGENVSKGVDKVLEPEQIINNLDTLLTSLERISTASQNIFDFNNQTQQDPPKLPGAKDSTNNNENRNIKDIITTRSKEDLEKIEKLITSIYLLIKRGTNKQSTAQEIVSQNKTSQKDDSTKISLLPESPQVPQEISTELTDLTVDIPDIKTTSIDDLINQLASVLTTPSSLNNNDLTSLITSLESILGVSQDILNTLNQELPKDKQDDKQGDDFDKLFRAALKDDEEVLQRNEKDPLGLLNFGEMINEKILAGFDLAEGKVNEKAREAGLDDDAVNDIVDNVSGVAISALTSFAPGASLGIAIAPLAAAFSALGIPIAAAASQLTPLAEMLIETLSIITPITTRLQTVAGTAQGGEEMFNFARNVSAETSAPLMTSIEGFSKLAAAAQGTRLEGKDVENLFIGVSKAISSLGLTSQDAGFIFLALQQVISKGKLTAEELRGQIGERLPGTMQLVADSLDMSLSEVSRALDNGELMANTVLPKLAKALDEKFSESSKQASKNFIGAINKIEAAIFNLQLAFLDAFGGIVAGVASAVAGILNPIVNLFDTIILSSGVMFNAILGMQAFIFAASTQIFAQTGLSKALMTAITGTYAKFAKVGLPFLYGAVVEVLASVIAEIFDIEIQDQVKALVSFFDTTIGYSIQYARELKREPMQIFEGLINIARGLGQGFINVGYALNDLRKTFFTTFKGIDGRVDSVTRKLNSASLGLNNFANNAISRLYLPRTDASTNQNNQLTQSTPAVDEGLFNFKSIGRIALEFTTLFLTATQTVILLKFIIGFLVNGTTAFLGFSAAILKSIAGMRVLNALINVSTVSFKGMALVLASLATLLVLVISKSRLTSDFLSPSSNAIKEIEKMQKLVNELTEKRITVEVVADAKLNDLLFGDRSTRFQDKGITLTFWRPKEVEQFTTDDLIRAYNKAVADRSISRNLPVISPNDNRLEQLTSGNIVNPDRTRRLRDSLISPDAQNANLETTQDAFNLRQELAARQRELTQGLLNNSLIQGTELEGIQKSIREQEIIIDELGVAFYGVRLLDKFTGDRRQLNQQRSIIEDGGDIPAFSPQERRRNQLEEQLRIVNLRIEKNLMDKGNKTERLLPSSDFRGDLNLSSFAIDRNTGVSNYFKGRGELLTQREQIIRQLESLENPGDVNPRFALEMSQEQDVRNLRQPLEQVTQDLKVLDRFLENPTNFTSGFDNNREELVKIFDALIATAPESTRERLSVTPERLQAIAPENVPDFLQGLVSQERANLDQQRSVIEPQLNNQDLTLASVQANRNILQRSLTAEIARRQELNEIPLNFESSEQAKIFNEFTQLQESIQSYTQKINELTGDIALAEIQLSNASGIGDSSLIQESSAFLNQLQTSLQQRREGLRLLQSKSLNLNPEVEKVTDDNFEIGQRNVVDRRIVGLQQQLASLEPLAFSASTKVESLNESLKDLDLQDVWLTSVEEFAIPRLESYIDIARNQNSLYTQELIGELKSLRDRLQITAAQGITTEGLTTFGQAPNLSNLAALELELDTLITRYRKELTGLNSLRTTELSSTKTVIDELSSSVNDLSKAIQGINNLLTSNVPEDARDEFEARRKALLQEQAELEKQKGLEENQSKERLAALDAQITEKERLLSVIAEQQREIESTKSNLRGDRRLMGNLDSTARELGILEPSFLEKFIARSNNPQSLATGLEAFTASLEPRLSTISSIASQQTNPQLRGLLQETLSTGSPKQIRELLDRIEFTNKGGVTQAFLDGKVLEGSANEMQKFKDSVESARKGLLNLEQRVSMTFGAPRKVLEESLGLNAQDLEREKGVKGLTESAATLANLGAITQEDLAALITPGTTLTGIRTRVGQISKRGGQTNFQGIIEDLKASGASESSIAEANRAISQLQDSIDIIAGTDVVGGRLPMLETVGEIEYGQFRADLERIDANTSNLKDSLNIGNFINARGDIDQYFESIRETELGQNIEDLNNLITELDTISRRRSQISNKLERSDLSSQERRDLVKEEQRLDDLYRTRFREKANIGDRVNESFDAAQAIDNHLQSMVQAITDSEIARDLKQTMIDNVEEVRDRTTRPILQMFQAIEDRVLFSGEELVNKLNKNIDKAVENLELSTAIIESTTALGLAAISKQARGMRENRIDNNLITNLGGGKLSIASTYIDPQLSMARSASENANVNLLGAEERLALAESTLAEISRDYEILESATAGSPTQMEGLKVAQEKLTTARQAYAEAESDYDAKLKEFEQARLDLLNIQLQRIVRAGAYLTNLKNIALKEGVLAGEIFREQMEDGILAGEIIQLELELKQNVTERDTILERMASGEIKDLDAAATRLDDLQNTYVDIRNNLLDKQIEQENSQREKTIQLLSNQIDLAGKYTETAVSGYERLNEQAGNYLKQLDSIQSAGDAIASLNQSISEARTGRLSLGSDLISAISSAREGVQNTEASPQQRSLDARRLSGLQSIASGYGIRGNLFNEAEALAAQEKISKQIANTKIEALKQEQALASKMLKLEIKRNEINAQVASREALINKLKAEQAVLQARLNLQKALEETKNSRDKTPVKLAELDLQIAELGLEGALENLSFTEQNNAIEQSLNKIKAQQLTAEQTAARDGLVGELVNDTNLDLSKVTQKLKNLRNFDPNDASTREVFGNVLNNLDRQKVKADFPTPEYTGDFAEDLRLLNEAQRQFEQAQRGLDGTVNKPLIEAEQSIFDLLGGNPKTKSPSITGGLDPVDIEKEISITKAEELGAILSPTQQMFSRAKTEGVINLGLKGLQSIDATAIEPATEVGQVLTNALLGELVNLTASLLNLNNSSPDTDVIEKLKAQEIVPPLIDKAIAEPDSIFDPANNNTIPTPPELPILPNYTPTFSNPFTEFSLPETGAPRPGVNPINTPAFPNLNPTLNPVFNPNIDTSVSVPSVNVHNRPPSTPLYYLNSLADKITPSAINYRIPPGVQQNTQSSDFGRNRIVNNTIQITNQIDANSQREMYSKIGEIQTKALVESLKNSLV